MACLNPTIYSGTLPKNVSSVTGTSALATTANSARYKQIEPLLGRDRVRRSQPEPAVDVCVSVLSSVDVPEGSQSPFGEGESDTSDAGLPVIFLWTPCAVMPMASPIACHDICTRRASSINLLERRNSASFVESTHLA